MNLCAAVRILFQIKEDEMRGKFSMHEDMRNVFRILVGKPEGERPLARFRPVNLRIKLK
jgi:hypothetical protein